MKRLFAVLAFILFFIINVKAQENDSVKVWSIAGSNSFLFSQSSFTNWNAGGESSLNFITGFNAHANRHTTKTDWENSIQAAIGAQRLEDTQLRKTNDLFDIMSKYGIKASEKLYSTFQLNLRSQFTQGFQYTENTQTLVSNFFAPAYLTLSIGLDYRPFPGMSFLASPVTGRGTIVLDRQLANQGAFGVRPAQVDSSGNIIESGQKYRQQMGTGITLRYSGKVLTNVNLVTRLDLFAQYDYLDVFDVNWDCQFDFKINRYLTANVSTGLIYDEDVLIMKEENINGQLVEVSKPRVQFKEILSLGLKFNY